MQDPDMPLWLSDNAQDFLAKTIVKDPVKRSTTAVLLKHPWLKSLGFKPPGDQMASSIAVVEPVLPPRPVMPLTEPEIVSLPPLAEIIKEVDVTVTAPEEIAVTATGTLAEGMRTQHKQCKCLFTTLL